MRRKEMKRSSRRGSGDFVDNRVLLVIVGLVLLVILFAVKVDTPGLQASFSGDNVTKSFSVGLEVLPESLTVFKGGRASFDGVDYQTNLSSGDVRFFVAPAYGESVRMKFDGKLSVVDRVLKVELRTNWYYWAAILALLAWILWKQRPHKTSCRYDPAYVLRTYCALDGNVFMRGNTSGAPEFTVDGIVSGFKYGEINEFGEMRAVVQPKVGANDAALVTLHFDLNVSEPWSLKNCPLVGIYDNDVSFEDIKKRKVQSSGLEADLRKALEVKQTVKAITDESKEQGGDAE